MSRKPVNNPRNVVVAAAVVVGVVLLLWVAGFFGTTTEIDSDEQRPGAADGVVIPTD